MFGFGKKKNKNKNHKNNNNKEQNNIHHDSDQSDLKSNNAVQSNVDTKSKTDSKKDVEINIENKNNATEDLTNQRWEKEKEYKKEEKHKKEKDTEIKEEQKNQQKTNTEEPKQPEQVAASTEQEPTKKPKKSGWFKRLRQGLSRNSSQWSDGLANVMLGKKTLDDNLIEEIETHLLLADVGVETTKLIIEKLQESLSRREFDDSDAMWQQLKTLLKDILTPCEQPLDITTHHPFSILMIGVNGAGKTTSIAKIAYYYQQQGKKIMLAAGDTFRAAAVEQLQTWGKRHDVPVISQGIGADSASVVFDALQSAKAKGIDCLLADTAGRLHTQDNLMRELEKIKRVMKKLNPEAPHETLLVLDASQGQNALQQAKSFHETINVTGLCLTKLDGTAKGGIIFALAQQLNIPIRFIGVGEKAEDLQPFDSNQFIEALFETKKSG